MKPSSATSPRPTCPQCGKKIRVMENVYERPVNPASGLTIASANKVKVGERPARNRYAPFCCLRHGWAYGKAQFERGRKKK